MTLSNARNDPFLAFRFEIRLDDLPPAGFSECTGLQLETEVQDYPEGGLNAYLLKFPGRTKQANLTLRRGIVDRQLWDWYYDITQGVVKLRNGTIAVHDPTGGTPVMEWRFWRAFPHQVVGAGPERYPNNIAVETLELCHQGLERSQ